MSVAFVLEKTRKIESMLRELGAQGKGLQDLVTSVESELSRDLVRATRKIASIRNKYVHTDGFSLDEAQLAGFEQSADFVIQELTHKIIQRDKQAQQSRTADGASDDSDGVTWKKVAKYGLLAVTAIIAIIGAANR